MRVPTLSEGTRSGVNWIREKVPPTTRARVWAASVFATPGTPSRRQCPSAIRAVSRRSTSRSCPTITRLTSKRVCSSSTPLASASTGLGTLARVSEMSVTVLASRADGRTNVGLSAPRRPFAARIGTTPPAGPQRHGWYAPTQLGPDGTDPRRGGRLRRRLGRSVGATPSRTRHYGERGDHGDESDPGRPAGPPGGDDGLLAGGGPGPAWAVLRLAGLERGPLVQAVAFTPYVAVGALRPAGAGARPATPLARGGRGRRGAGVDRRGGAPRGRRRAAGGRRARAAAAHRQPAHGRRRRRPPLVDLVRAHRVDVLTVQEFTPARRPRWTGRAWPTLLPYRQLNPRGGHHRLGPLLPVPAHRRRLPAQRGFAFSQAYGDRAPCPARRRYGSSRPTRPPRTPSTWCRHWRTDLRAQPPATPRRAAEHPGRRLQRHPRPRSAARPDRHRLRRRRRRRPAPAWPAPGARTTATRSRRSPSTTSWSTAAIAVRVGHACTPLPGSDHRAVLADLRLP